MTVFLNGLYLSEEEAVVSVFDRGFLYGDGFFETLRVFNGKPFRWAQHLERLRQGADFLNLKVPFTAEALRNFADRLVSMNQMPDSLLRLTLSRGIGPRGYSPKGAERPTLVMSLHPAPAHSRGGGKKQEAIAPAWKLITASPRLPAAEPLARFKSCNKLPQILARLEADAAGADEALLLNTDGFVVEGAGSNLFWIHDGAVCTPPLAGGILAGVTRAVTLEICRSIGIASREGNCNTEELKNSQAIFLTLSSLGVVEAGSLDGHPLNCSALVQKLGAAYWELLCTETA